MEQLAGRVAVITGSASGLGRGMAERFAQEGMTAVITGKCAIFDKTDNFAVLPDADHVKIPGIHESSDVFRRRIDIKRGERLGDVTRGKRLGEESLDSLWNPMTCARARAVIEYGVFSIRAGDRALT